ncbi:YafY family protein [Planktothrix sp. FACHB-1365]|uniref:helix-turn-helix transcriptional regulator n=1 Tax=Planktothrix sp. FACHB-1365 TaxID=2692855 RepID=UPI0016881D58|nr:WYL domain-containing protein [Planktothrix sp. FACHB-1365]MBD2482815.1 WYL domain-containing protein [Planktothrix sp. FACHB-1365]
MAKKPTLHPYSDQQAFERLMLLIATLVQYPGVGNTPPTQKGEHRNALSDVQYHLQQLASELKINLPAGYPALPTIRKDIETLRRYSILEQRMYRWGYYLGTGVMSWEELQVAFQLLVSLSQYQADSKTRRICETLEKRLRGVNLERKGEFFYPVRQQLNRSIVWTDPDEMLEMGNVQHTLFHQLDQIENAILTGKAIEISRFSDPYNSGQIGLVKIWPLQLIHFNIAWYLLYESCENGQLTIGRMNRYGNYCQLLSQTRPLQEQYDNLQKAHQLLNQGWGLNLGNLVEQQQELAGELPLELVHVRFFPPATNFILEGDRRHIRQQIKVIKDKQGKLLSVDYKINLPSRSLNEFMIWVNKYLNLAQVLSPPELAQKQYQAACQMVERYQNIWGDLP